ncbi:putative leader peptide [Streptomyces sp. SID3343]
MRRVVTPAGSRVAATPAPRTRLTRRLFIDLRRSAGCLCL